jgi:hypothetical protein
MQEISKDIILHSIAPAAGKSKRFLEKRFYAD